MVPLLNSMLGDSDLGNHRLALTTLNSAIHNKMDLLVAHLDQLLPAVFGDAHLKPELIREVQMGPFKHKVDDGLDLRKVTYSPATPDRDRDPNNMNPERLRNPLCLSGYIFLARPRGRAIRPRYRWH